MNQLSDEIPSEIGSLINLSKLYLYGNVVDFSYFNINSLSG